ncbi:MAG: radical SAM protein [Chloroflexota bacterium]
MNLENHPCFNENARLKHGRIHLPVAPRCNVQCNFCSRKYDCVNESRPGVTSHVLSPGMALAYLKQALQARRDIAVVGIAGPGDPFANPDETIETLNLVRAAYPDMLLCVATNGLALSSQAAALARLHVSHVTVTVNAVDAKIGAQIYGWVRYGKRVYRGEEAARILLENQLAAIAEMKAMGVTVKVNTVIMPGINDHHVEEIAAAMAERKVDILNCIPVYAVEGSAFANLPEPDAALVHHIRQLAGRHIPQMRHCTRCRADAVGLLGETGIPDFQSFLPIEGLLADASSVAHPTPARPYMAATSREGMLVNQHLGEAEQVYVYAKTPDGIDLVSIRPTPSRGAGDQRWLALADLIGDCHTLLVNGIGPNPRRVLVESGVQVLEVEGMVTEIMYALDAGKGISHHVKRETFACGAGCSGTGGGCG